MEGVSGESFAPSLPAGNDAKTNNRGSINGGLIGTFVPTLRGQWKRRRLAIPLPVGTSRDEPREFPKRRPVTVGAWHAQAGRQPAGGRSFEFRGALASELAYEGRRKRLRASRRDRLGDFPGFIGRNENFDEAQPEIQGGAGAA